MKTLRKTELLFVTLACACGLWCIAGWSEPSISNAKAAAIPLSSTGFFGRIEIPDLGFSSAVVEGTDAASLRRGVGHISGTAMPGGLGNVGLAGHRDTVFRPLRRIRPGMDVVLEDGSGRFHYAVDSTEIVLPDAVSVLGLSAMPELTLVTCFPFDYVGSAPKRFVVHAHLKSLVGDRAEMSR